AKDPLGSEDRPLRPGDPYSPHGRPRGNEGPLMAVPILVLSPSYTEDSITLAEAAWRQGWEVCRLARWHEWAPLVGREVAVYGELMFAAYLAEALGLVLLEPPVDWLCRLPWAYRKRDVLATTLEE